MEPASDQPASTKGAIFVVLACCALAVLSVYVIVQAGVDPVAFPTRGH